jgi:hypothetical protein
MDEQAFRETLLSLDTLSCVFRKPVLSRCCACGKASKMNIAEREAVNCTDERAYAQCRELAGLLRENSRFALKIHHPFERLPHGQIMRIYCGGLLGLQSLLNPDQSGTERVDDIHALVAEACARYGELEAIPYTEVVKVIVHYQWRRRGPLNPA